jgi:uncharacterized protein
MANAQQEQRIIAQLADELSVKVASVKAAVTLLDEGATVPFIARYRKEATDGLDDTQLRNLVDRLTYLRELEERRQSILESIESQGKLTDELALQINAADTKQRLEDLYLPYKQKRRTRAQIAKEAGLEPLADLIFSDAAAVPDALAPGFINAEKGVADAKAALDGARDILSERFAENADLLAALREKMWNGGHVMASVVEGKEQEGAKFRDYFQHNEPLHSAPSHRVLAILRGREQGVLNCKIDLAERLEADARSNHPMEGDIAHHNGLRLTDSSRDKFLGDVCRWTWRVKLSSQLETELVTKIREQAETEAIAVFARNLKDLLLAAPAGGRVTMGLDPGIRTGVKVAVVDSTGKLLETQTIYPHEPRKDWDGSLAILGRMCKQHSVDLIAIGNGTAGRETDKLAADLMKLMPEQHLTKIMVSEAGASVYSASELAAKEFPDLDVSLRGAVSIARRLQDPLAELVKIDPKSIGVGQYQHDVDQRAMAHTLSGVVEDCVNAVGVEVNTASEALLARVSGLNNQVARSIVDYRNQHGRFTSRDELKKVPRLGEKTFEQAAGFLRIQNADNPLDQSAVHPEAYPVVQRILAKIQKTVKEVVGQSSIVRKLDAADFVDDRFGLPTVKDILLELEKPGRDPRPEFKSATFDDAVHTLADLQPGMILEGVVTNVAAFGAFVDIGVHQDGLVHISALSSKFVKDAHEVVKAGEVVKVKVLEVDAPRKRIALTMRLADEINTSPVAKGAAGSGAGADRNRSSARPGSPSNSSGPANRQGGKPGSNSGNNRGSQGGFAGNNAFAEAFAKAKKN